ncbi:MAG: HyaD/HybD family hydrogenase maturation endopeptidase [Deltaproteobacteria bacterium]|nr:HyaD/HybD family hydrogenase maturation endopeptidase [Deltaproteobacteria bacterium]
MRVKKTRPEEKIAILGLGNILLQDEGVGVHAIEALRKGFAFPKNVQLIDGGTMGIDLFSFIEGMDKILIIDAVNIKKEPGTIVTIEDKEIPSFPSAKLSVHQIAFPDVLSALKLQGRTPAKMALVGIQPESIETGLGMSEAVYKNFDRLIKTVLHRLNEWGVEVKGKQEGQRVKGARFLL